MLHRKLIVLVGLAWTLGFGGSAVATTYDLTGQPTVNTIDIGFGVPSGTFGLTGSIDITLSQDLGTTAEFSVNAYVLSIDIDTNGVFFEASDVIIETTPFVHIPAVEPTFSGDAQFPGPVTLTTDSASGTWNLQGRIGEYDAPGLFGGNSDILSLASGTFSGSFLNPTELLMTIGFTGQPQLGPFILIDPFPPLTFAAAAIINVPGDFATIQAAIDAALSGTTEVVVAPGTYNETIDFLGKGITLRSSSGAVATTIDGTGLNDSVVKCISGEGPDTVLDGFTITNGTGDPSAFGASQTVGGGMRNDGASPTVRNCAFVGNTASLAGGGMYNLNNSHPTVTDSTFSGNWGQNRGGGMAIEGSSTATITNSRFIGNSSDDQAGAIYDDPAAFVTSTFTNCAFIGNTVVGGFFGGFGGAILTNNGSSPILANCAFVGNTAPDWGGAIAFVWDSGDLTVTNCTFIGNGGGQGGGLWIHSNGASRTVTNCIFWNNSDGGGTDESGQIHIPAGAVAGTTIVTYSDIQALVPGGTFDSSANTNNINADPLFVDADGADNIPGTEDDNLRLLPGSPVIDAADNTAVPADATDLDGDLDITERIPFDLDGNPRFADSAAVADIGVDDLPNYPEVVDMGAYEAVPGTPCITDDECAGVNLGACTVEKCIGGFCVSSPFISGDIDKDGNSGLGDLLVLLNILGGAPEDPNADTDGNGSIGLGDLLVLLNLLGGAAPACPA